jgi:hypothetical protein
MVEDFRGMTAREDRYTSSSLMILGLITGCRPSMDAKPSGASEQ